jgi:predicted house-cleaning noncanonical NTP pyrophosphatase (MazG superfamily)
MKEKLVRDKIPEIIKKNGDVPHTRTADDEEYWSKLLEKLEEEVEEFFENNDIGEMIDIIEVLEAMCAYKKFSIWTLYQLKRKKAKERGKFLKRIILQMKEERADTQNPSR